ncbi:MAG TPA: 50S ribosomal protein L19e [Candidatus Acidoferrales bacterium]|nr:50S ribosomal protein L19e [Candidatus Acidoferrales bacterium]
MTDLKNQKRLASKILGVGVSRVWLDPEKLEDIANVITREDIRGLVEAGTIKRIQSNGISRGRAKERDVKREKGHRKGHGRRRGAKGARTPKKALWIRRIRAQRKRLKALRNDNTLDRKVYRKMYRKAKGGVYRNIAVLTSEAHALAASREEQ